MNHKWIMLWQLVFNVLKSGSYISILKMVVWIFFEDDGVKIWDLDCNLQFSYVYFYSSQSHRGFHDSLHVRNVPLKWLLGSFMLCNVHFKRLNHKSMAQNLSTSNIMIANFTNYDGNLLERKRAICF